LQKCIFTNSIKLIELCVLKLDQDWFLLLDLLAIVFNPMSRYDSHLFISDLLLLYYICSEFQCSVLCVDVVFVKLDTVAWANYNK